MVRRWSAYSVLLKSAYTHPRLNYAAFVAVAEEIRRGGLARNGFQKKSINSENYDGERIRTRDHFNCGAALDHLTTATVLRHVEDNFVILVNYYIHYYILFYECTKITTQATMPCTMPTNAEWIDCH